MIEIFTPWKPANIFSPILCPTPLEIWFTFKTLPTISYHHVPVCTHPKTLRFSYISTSCSHTVLEVNIDKTEFILDAKKEPTMTKSQQWDYKGILYGICIAPTFLYL